MRRIINWVLLLGTIISVAIVLKYSALPVPAYIPDEWVIFWTSSSDDQQKYALLYDIANGFIMSALFYFVIEEIPDKARIHKAKYLISPQINQLAENMEQIITVVIKKYNRNPNLNELTEKDFFILNGDVQRPLEEISYRTTTYSVKKKKQKIAVHQYGTINALIKDNVNSIQKLLDTIKNYEYFYASDERLVKCIRNIENCALIRCYAKNEESKNDSPCFLFADTSKTMIHFIILYLELLKLNFHTEYTVTMLDSPEETEQYRNDRENGTLVQLAYDIQAKRKNAAASNPVVIISGSKYTTGILISQLKRNFIAEYLTLNDIENIGSDKLDSFKYIVFIIDSDTRDRIIYFLNTNDISSDILLLSEQTIFKKGIRKRVSRKNHIIDECFFRTSFHISGFPFMFCKHEPSGKNIAVIQKKLETALHKIER